jgi:hypothetical protein
MTSEPLRRRAAARATAEIKKAIAEAKAAYQFVPNTYTFGALSACLAAEQALAVLSDALSEEERGQEARPRPQKSRL